MINRFQTLSTDINYGLLILKGSEGMETGGIQGTMSPVLKLC